MSIMRRLALALLSATGLPNGVKIILRWDDSLSNGFSELDTTLCLGDLRELEARIDDFFARMDRLEVEIRHREWQ